MRSKQRIDNRCGELSPPPTSAPTFVEVYAAYFDFVWTSARYLGVAENDIDDVVQEAFIVVHGRLSTLSSPELLRSWIYGIVRRVTFAYFRMKQVSHNRLRLWGFEADLDRAEVPLPSRRIEASEERDLLLYLLNELDPEKREAFVLMELEGMSAPEVAATIGVPLNTVYSRIRFARQETEAAFKRYRARTRFSATCTSELVSSSSSHCDNQVTHGQARH